MNRISTFLLTIFLGIYFSTTAQIDDYQQDIISLLNCNGTVQKYDFEYEKTLVSLKLRVAADNTPQSFWNKFREGKKESLDELITLIAFAYRKNYSHADIRELINYYNTSAAQKLLDNNKDFTEEELTVFDEYKNSEIAKVVESKKENLAADIKEIFYVWNNELFGKGMGALAKARYTKKG